MVTKHNDTYYETSDGRVYKEKWQAANAELSAKLTELLGSDDRTSEMYPTIANILRHPHRIMALLHAFEEDMGRG